MTAALKTLLRTAIYRAALAVTKLRPARKRRHYRATVLKLDRLGDAALSLGAVRLITEHFGEAQTLLLVSPIAEGLFRLEFPRAEVVVLPAFCSRWWPDFFQFLWTHGRTLRETAVDTLVCLRHPTSDYLHAIARLIDPAHCHASRWTGPGSPPALFFPRVTLSAWPDKTGTPCLELEAHRRVVESALARPVTAAEVLPSIQAVKPVSGDALLVCPLAGEVIRQYPPPLLARALRTVLSATPRPLHFCLPPEAEAAPWQTALEKEGLTCDHWHRPPDLAALVHAIAASRAVLAPESGPADLALALGKPGVFLLGGGHHGLLAPWRRHPHQVWLDLPMDCYGCDWRCRHPEPYCLTHIPPAVVAAELQRILA